MASWPSCVTRRLSFSMPRRPRVSASRCGPEVSTDRRCRNASVVREGVVFGIDASRALSAAMCRSLLCSTARSTTFGGIFSSGHFNISPDACLRPLRRPGFAAVHGSVLAAERRLCTCGLYRPRAACAIRVSASQAPFGPSRSDAAIIRRARARPVRHLVPQMHRRVRAPRPPRVGAGALLRGPHERRIARADRLHQHEVPCRATRRHRASARIATYSTVHGPMPGSASNAARRLSASARAAVERHVASGDRVRETLQRRYAFTRHADLREIDGGQRGGRREAPRGVLMRMPLDARAGALHQSADDGGRRLHADLLADDCAHHQLEARPRAGYAQAGHGFDQRREPRVARRVRRRSFSDRRAGRTSWQSARRARRRARSPALRCSRPGSACADADARSACRCRRPNRSRGDTRHLPRLRRRASRVRRKSAADAASRREL